MRDYSNDTPMHMDAMSVWRAILAIVLAVLARRSEGIDPAVLKQLGLPEPSTIYVPIHVNLLFIGFDKKLQHAPDISFDDLKSWLETSSVNEPLWGRHVKLTSPSYGSRSLLRGADLGISTDVAYEFRVQLVEMSSLVHAALEAALKTFMRLETVSEQSMYQVDSDKMATLFESLLHSLNISDYYNILVLNPGKAVVRVM